MYGIIKINIRRHFVFAEVFAPLPPFQEKARYCALVRGGALTKKKKKKKMSAWPLILNDPHQRGS